MKTLPVVALLLVIFTSASSQITVTLKPDSATGIDCTIYSGIPDNNFADDRSLASVGWTCGGSPCIDRALLKFDLSSIPVSAFVINASLSLYANPGSTVAATPMSGSANAAVIRQVTSPWSESTVTWNTQPSASVAGQVGLPQSTSGYQNYPSIDVSNFVQAWVANPAINYGMLLRLVTEAAYNCMIFASSDHADSTLHPELTITYLANDTCVRLKPSSNGDDCTLFSGFSSINFGSSEELMAISWTCGGSPCIDRGVVKFDLSGIPSNAVITNAYVKLFANFTSTSFPLPMSGVANEARLSKIISPWSENLVSWDTQPLISSTGQVVLPQSTDAYSNDFADVTSFVQDWHTNPAANYGMMLSLSNEQPYNCRSYASSDHSIPSLHPELSVCYAIVTDVMLGEKENDIAIYPNPFSKGFSLGISVKKAENYDLEIRNLAGQVVYSTLLKCSNGQVEYYIGGNEIQDLPSGVYFLILNGNERSYVSQLVH